MREYQPQSPARPSSTLGPKPGYCWVVIKAVRNQAPAAGYPSNVNHADQFSYDADVQTPNGLVPFRLLQTMSIVPKAKSRWPRPWMVEAFAVGDELAGTVLDGVVFINDGEERWSAPCGWVPDTSTPPPRQPPTLDTDLPAIPIVGKPFPGTYPSIPEPGGGGA